MKKRPTIGITPDINDLEAPETEYVVRRNYADAVLDTGGLPFILPYSGEVSAYLANLDGLLVTGGMFDIDPKLYRQSARKSYVMKPARTHFEKALIEGALERQVPVLGICNGMQLLAVCLGGELVQDIPSEMPAAYEHKLDQPATIPQHEVAVPGNSWALPALRAGSYVVNSVHHQAVLPSPAYRQIGSAPDGVIEAIEAVGGGFALGIQWHPEYRISEIDQEIWQGFIAAAAEHLSKRSALPHG
ncbi:gamma-glutamyl-gamma-aminobutyrate hydrolase family protein [Neorhizobium lilium]|uniref:Gamma-glutamyl-gamma-aminobutyrate hydrolase family protein n=1 Tax=Neorhizobium lilium TaxID=2503024 RepID=A0A3S3VQL9_9HYPH|nr:gamma-glutamyl-gamma-aminobutyrate hydrolase family protein [Neorhizobium lilium]